MPVTKQQNNATIYENTRNGNFYLGLYPTGHYGKSEFSASYFLKIRDQFFFQHYAVLCVRIESYPKFKKALERSLNWPIVLLAKKERL